MLKQLSVFAENKPGRVAEITTVLGENDIDIRALSIADTTNFGIVRMIVDKPQKAELLLKAQGFTVSQTDVLAIGVNDKPGGLSYVLNILSDNAIDVEYMYAFISRDIKKAYVIVKVKDSQKTLEVLTLNGVSILTDADIV